MEKRDFTDKCGSLCLWIGARLGPVESTWDFAKHKQ